MADGDLTFAGDEPYVRISRTDERDEWKSLCLDMAEEIARRNREDGYTTEGEALLARVDRLSSPTPVTETKA